MPSKIRKRNNGTYSLSVAVGYDENGKQIIKTKTVNVSSQRGAVKAYNEFAAEVRKGTVAYTGKLKLRDFAKQWFQEYCQKKLAPQTQRAYKNQIDNRIIPALGHIEIKELRPLHIIQFINTLEGEGVRFDGRKGKISGEAVIYCFRVLSSMLQDALQWQIISVNPCAQVKPPSVKHHKPTNFDEDSVARMINALNDEPLKYRIIINLALDSGLRLGELMGLQWSDIDFEKSILSVTKSNQALRGKGIFTKSPKNETSVRNVALSENMLTQLKEYHKWQIEQKELLANQWHDEGWLFTQWNGKPMFPSTPSHWFKKFLKRHNLPNIAFHDLRHLSATLLISFGVPLKNVSSRLGHADIRTTANIYGAALQSVDHQAANQMNEYWKNIINKK